MKRSLAILAALVLALGVVGVGYATWMENITIHATVTTGTLSWVWLTYDNVDMKSASLDSVVGLGGPNLDIAISNTYPGWEGSIRLYEKNTGTLPLTFYGFRFDVTSDPGGLIGHYWVRFYQPDGTTVNYQAKLSDINGVEITYASAIPGWIPAYGLINPGANHFSKVELVLDSTAPQSYASPFVFTFTHHATVALP